MSMYVIERTKREKKWSKLVDKVLETDTFIGLTCPPTTIDSQAQGPIVSVWCGVYVLLSSGVAYCTGFAIWCPGCYRISDCC